MSKKKFPFTNREQSWLEFNRRILDLAKDDSLPLLERLKFLSIFSTNLDEFYMVRVGGLQTLASENNIQKDPSGLTPAQQLEKISTYVQQMVKSLYECFTSEIEPALKISDIRRISISELTSDQKSHIDNFFDKSIFPILSPIAVTPPLQVPLLSNKSLHIAVSLEADKTDPQTLRYAFIPVSKNLNRLIPIQSGNGYHFMLVEDVISLFVNKLFPGETITECVPFRVTRNADLMVREDQAFDLVAEMEAVIDARKRSDFVRLETVNYISDEMLGFLQSSFDVDNCDIFKVNGPVDLSSFMKLTDLQGYAELKNEPLHPQPSVLIDPGVKIFDQLPDKNILIYHPYESFEPVIRMIEEAADDPDVIAIKQILYRTSRNSPIVASLIRAAEKGKSVTVLMELKARFDEERNIEWAKELEDAGAQVLYGVKGLKTHAKVCLIIRREPDGLARYIHFGTGNYNEITAHLYCDVSYFTRDEDMGADVSSFFNAITGYSQPIQYRKIESAPLGLREKLLELITNEKERKLQGQKAFIKAKLNSLADSQIIAALYDASKAGVKIELNIRGICCLIPGIRGISDNITVTSIVDRFLEHARILQFHHGGDDKLYISTADWMPRNLDRRIELLIPVEDPESKSRLIEILDICLKDNSNAWRLLSDGTYERLKPSGKKGSVRAQELLYQNVKNTYQKVLKTKRRTFEPYRSKEKI
jgi:polyphosphate kinase